jgi:hypothetical protein
MSGAPPIQTFELGSARGGARPKAVLAIEIVRSLTSDDLEKLTSPDAIGSKALPLKQLRATHHQLAQLLSQGRSETEASLITGYSPSRISILKADPSFQELMSSYGAIRQAIFVDTLERLKTLGLSTLEELQERLENAPEKWSNRELMELATLALVKPLTANTPIGINPGAAVGVAIQVQFVKADTPALVLTPTALKQSPPTIEHNPGDAT